MLVPSPSLMHVTSYDILPDSKVRLVELVISSNQFKRLCDYIMDSFQCTNNGDVQLLINKGYTPTANFYEAKGAYTAINTCNYWINKGLHLIGVRTSVWSPSYKGIFYHLDRIK